MTLEFAWGGKQGVGAAQGASAEFLKVKSLRLRGIFEVLKKFAGTGIKC